MNERAVEALADQLLAGVHRDGDVVTGPMMWRASDGTEPRAGYFSVATCGLPGFQIHRINAANSAERERIIVALARRGACAVWPLRNDDGAGELEWMRVVEQVWPGELMRLRDQRSEPAPAA
jgi:hypothetical protein